MCCYRMHTLSTAFKQLQFITHKISSQLFYSLSAILFFEYSSTKASGLFFIFVRVSADHAHFQNNVIHVSQQPKRPIWVFFNTICAPITEQLELLRCMCDPLNKTLHSSQSSFNDLQGKTNGLSKLQPHLVNSAELCMVKVELWKGNKSGQQEVASRMQPTLRNSV